MTTATQTERRPVDAVLQFHVHAVGVPKAYHKKVFAFENRRDEAWSWLIGQLEQLADSTIRNFLIDRDRLKTEWANQSRDIATEFAALAWERFETMLALIPAHSKEVADKLANFESTVAAIVESLRELGINDAMQASGKNPNAAEHQLRVEAERDDACLMAKGELNRAIEAERVLLAQIEAIPTFTRCRIRWPQVPVELAEVAALVGIERTTEPDRFEYSDIGRRIVRDLGFEGSPLLAAHVAAVEYIAGTLTSRLYHPLETVTDEQLPEVRKAMEVLPKTPQVSRFLSSTRNGIPQLVL
jgi:hypothetical protein